MNTYAQQIKAKLDDPATSTAEYRAAWNEWQAIVFQQAILDQQGAERQRENQLTRGWVYYWPAGVVNHHPAR
jgi:uncharacterized protein YjlB